jgi:hypothetical protein
LTNLPILVPLETEIPQKLYIAIAKNLVGSLVAQDNEVG